MSREILFRGKRVDNGEWIRGDLITTPFIRNTTQQNIIYILDATKADYDCFEDLVEDNGIFEVDPDTVGQYIGVKDKNEKEIYEGDIVRNQQGEVYKVEYYTSVCRFVLQTKTGTWKDIEIDYGNLPVCSEIEVIGNIFENQELLGGTS